MNIPKPLILIILDGWGINPEIEGNAVANADTPVMDYLMGTYPHSTLEASGKAVGLPPGQMGNSEVGHLNLGSGRVVYQDITRIDKSIKDGDFFSNKVLTGAVEHALANGSSLHLMGLLSGCPAALCRRIYHPDRRSDANTWHRKNCYDGRSLLWNGPGQQVGACTACL